MPSKQTKQDSFEKQNGVKDDTDVSNDSAVVKRGDNVNYTGYFDLPDINGLTKTKRYF